MSPSMQEARVRIRRLIFAWLTVTTALAITACGQKSDRAFPPPQTAPQPEPGPQEPQGDETGEDQSGDQGGIEGGEVIMDPRGLKPKEIFAASERLGPTKPGRSAGKGLYYSGSGQDFLREQLIELVNSEPSRAQRIRNEDFAREIKLTTFEISKDGRAKVSITLARKNGRLELPDVDMKPTGDRRYTGFEKTQGITVDAACMDASDRDPGCNTVHLRLKRKVKGNPAVAHVIARRTAAYFYVQGQQPGTTGNTEYDKILEIFIKSVRNPGAAGTIRSSVFYTTEVMNGASEFAVMMSVGVPDQSGRLKNQLIGWHGPLVKPSRSMNVNLLVKAPNVTREIRGQRVKVPFRNLGTTHLVRNDGRGNLQFNITVSGRPTRVLKLTVARIHTPTRTELVLH